MKRLGACLLSCQILLAVAAQFAPASAETPEEYYRGKVVRLVVGYGPGGGYDIYARMIAPYISKALAASVIIENQPGAGGLTALNRTMSNPPDGLQIMIVNGLGAALSQLMAVPGVRYDLAKLSNLGTVSASPWVWIVGAKSPIKSVDDALKADRRLMWAASGQIDGVSDGAAFTCEALHLRCSIVFGYPGTNEAALAVGKGEMDMMYVSDTSANNYVATGETRALASMGRNKSRFFPNAPTIFEAAKLGSSEAALIDFHAAVETLGRILVAPPGIPADRLAYLRAAIKNALNDPTLIAEGEKTQRYVDFIDADTTAKATTSVVTKISPEQKKRVIEIIQSAEKN